MQNATRLAICLSLASVTFLIGVGCVRAAELVASIFSRTVEAEVPVVENIGVSSSENFRTLMPPDHEMTIGKGRVMSCYDPTILPIWGELKNDSQFQDRLDGQTGVLNCSDLIEVAEVNLNRRGPDETVARGKGPALCSATGNCGFWVFAKRGKRWKTILTGNDASEHYVAGEQIQTVSTRGYSDIILTGHFSAGETSFRTYKFDGERYAEARCMYEVPKRGGQGEGSWMMITCAEFSRRTERDLAPGPINQ